MRNYRKIIQVISLILFGVLIFTGKMQLWLAIFLVGLFLSTMIGRVYCGYICPINTVTEVIDKNADKKKRKRIKTPNWMKSPFVRYGVLGLFLLTMVFVIITGKKLPVLPVLFAAGVILTIFFEPSFWHRYLCPYGTLLSIFSTKKKKGYFIENENCIKCGICVRACPSDAIIWDDKKNFPEINRKECLVCGKCEEVCPKDTIKFLS